MIRSGIAGLFAVSLLVAQAPTATAPKTDAPAPAMGARELYFTSMRKETLPPLKKVSAPKPPRTGTASTPPPRTETPIKPAANLGLRYNVMLVNATNGTSQAVDSERIFRSGECFALELESNRAGYLYVLVKESSGNWRPMFPSALMPGESNVISPGVKARVPDKFCFEITDPPGVEQLYVVLSRNPDDLYRLHDAIQQSATEPEPAPARAEPQPMLMASARVLNTEAARLSAYAGSRDLMIRKVEQPVDSRDRAHAVYVVNVSKDASSQIVTEIKIRHR